MIKTKIIATVGPASADTEVLGALIEAGVDVFRLNFSHGTLARREQMLENIRRAAEARGEIVAVMGDLAGQKIRVSPLAEPIKIAQGQDLLIAAQPGRVGAITTTYPGIVEDVEVGQQMLIDDGQLRFEVVEKSPGLIRCRCRVGGTIQSSKGINLPETVLRCPSLTPKDFEDLDWAIAQELDYVAVSFVRTPDDLRAVNDRIAQAGSGLLSVPKIEKPQALEHLDALIELGGAVMVARGDLGVEMDVAQVPIIQKDIARRCQQAGKPVIIATQMLQSMVEHPFPTRAEVSDVANAIYDRCDAVMLSAESAVGQFPAAAVGTLNHVAETVERYIAEAQWEAGAAPKFSLRELSAVAHGAAVVAHEVGARLLVVWSHGGTTARLLSKCRPEMPIVGISRDAAICRQMAMHYGVLPVQMEQPADKEEMLAAVDRCVLTRGWAQAGDLIIVVLGTRLDRPGATSRLYMRRVAG